MNRYPEAYIDFLIYFNGERDYFECHEVLEEYWKEHPDSSYSDLWVGLIQLAVGLYHQRRNNLVGARKMLTSALAKLTAEDLSSVGIDAKTLLSDMRQRCEWLNEAQGGARDGAQKSASGEASGGASGGKQENQLDEAHVVPFIDIDIPIADEALLAHCRAECRQRHIAWGKQSDLDDEALIHKHKLRDRSDVIAERRAQLEKRVQQRNSN